MTGPVPTEALIARIAELEAENTQLAVERNEALALRRWNIDRTGDGEVLVCRGYHDKGEDCDHERFVPAGRLATATSELARLRGDGEAKERRIAVLEAALAPFADAAGLFGPPAAGREYTVVDAQHLRAARAATAREG